MIYFFSLAVSELTTEMTSLRNTGNIDYYESGSDLFDSDRDCEFDAVEYGKRKSHELSDSETEIVVSELKKQRLSQASTVDPGTSHTSAVEEPDDVDPIDSEREVDASGSESEVNQGDGREGIITDFDRCKRQCLAALNKASSRAKGTRRLAFQRSIEALVVQKTPSEVDEDYARAIETAKKSLLALQEELKAKVQSCKDFWHLQISSLTKSSKLPRIRTGIIGGRM